MRVTFHAMLSDCMNMKRPDPANPWSVIVAIVCLTVAAAASAEENWSRSRVPTGSCVAAGARFSATWTADDYAWAIELPGEGHSSPVAWGDRLFVTTADEQSGELSLLAIDADSGRSLWTKRLGAEPHHLHAANSYASSTPAVD